MSTHRLSVRILPHAVLIGALAACGGDRPSPPETVDDAAEAAVLEPGGFDASLFDTVAWADPRDAADRGATVYAYSCAKCHGDSGAGNGGYQLGGRVLQPPSFLAEDWRFAGDVEGLREYIYNGNDKGMPHWGKVGLSPRDMDAVALYIVRRLWSEG